MDFTPKGGNRTILKRVAVQCWVNKKIVHETHYHQQPIRVPGNSLSRNQYLYTSEQEFFPKGS
jgi:hypothetical protein